jgi:hypothetical protein
VCSVIRRPRPLGKITHRQRLGIDRMPHQDVCRPTTVRIDTDRLRSLRVPLAIMRRDYGGSASMRLSSVRHELHASSERAIALVSAQRLRRVIALAIIRNLGPSRCWPRLRWPDNARAAAPSSTPAPS